MKEEIKTIDEMKERMLKSFLYNLDQLAFVKSTDSVSGKEEELNPVVEDREAIIIIQGEFDREDLKNLIVSISG